MTLRAYDENDALMWEYVTPDSLIAPFATIEYLGMNNGLVYISESSLYDESMGDDLSKVYGRLRALRAGDGSVVWENTDYSGSGFSSVFDEDGSVYLTSYIGTDCTKIDGAGKTVWSIPSVNPDLCFAYDISLDKDVLTVYYEMNANGESDTRCLSVDGEIIG